MHGLCWMLEIIRTRLTKTWGKSFWMQKLISRLWVKIEDKTKSFLTFKDSKVFSTYPFWRGYLNPHSSLTRVKTKEEERVNSLQGNSSEKKCHDDHCAARPESCQAKSDQEVYSKKKASKTKSAGKVRNLIRLQMWWMCVLFQTRKKQRQSESPGESKIHKTCTS